VGFTLSLILQLMSYLDVLSVLVQTEQDNGLLQDLASDLLDSGTYFLV
jgi:hypothetical protein